MSAITLESLGHLFPACLYDFILCHCPSPPTVLHPDGFCFYPWNTLFSHLGFVSAVPLCGMLPSPRPCPLQGELFNTNVTSQERPALLAPVPAFSLLHGSIQPHLVLLCIDLFTCFRLSFTTLKMKARPHLCCSLLFCQGPSQGLGYSQYPVRTYSCIY